MKSKNFKEFIVKDWTRKELAEELFFNYKDRARLKKEYFSLLERFLELVDDDDEIGIGEQVKDEKNNIFVVKSINNKNGTLTLKKVKSDMGRKKNGR